MFDDDYSYESYETEEPSWLVAVVMIGIVTLAGAGIWLARTLWGGPGLPLTTPVPVSVLTPTAPPSPTIPPDHTEAPPFGTATPTPVALTPHPSPSQVTPATTAPEATPTAASTSMIGSPTAPMPTPPFDLFE